MYDMMMYDVWYDDVWYNNDDVWYDDDYNYDGSYHGTFRSSQIVIVNFLSIQFTNNTYQYNNDYI